MAYSTSMMASAADGLSLRVHSWTPDRTPIGLVQISHGLAEHAGRYQRFAEALNGAGFLVFGHDHRGHGGSLLADNAYGQTGDGGWPALMSDLFQVTAAFKEDAYDLPLFLFGHSMGSFAAQSLILDRAEAFSGVILSGSTDVPTVMQLVMSTGEMPSFAAYNAAFAPNRTEFDWLSRDEAEVDAYIADPACGWDAPDSFTLSMMQSLAELGDEQKLAGLPKSLPVLLVAGDKDPLNGGLGLLEALKARYVGAGLESVETAFYDGGRHEMLNEINKEDVTSDIIEWLKAQT